MKLLERIRYWLLCALLALVLCGLFYALNQRTEESGAWQRAALVASIADEQTTVLLHFPSVNDAGRAYAEADLARLWQMTAVQELFARPLSETPEMQALEPYWKQCLALRAQEAMLAVSLQSERPQMLMAFQTDEDLSQVWRPACTWIQGLCEGESSEVIEHVGEAIYRRVGLDTNQVVQARWRDWCLTGTDEQAVRLALGRLQSNTIQHSVAESAAFSRALKTLPGDYLSLSYVDATKVREADKSLESAETESALTSQPWFRHLNRVVQMAIEAKLQAVALTSSVRDGKMVDQASLLADHQAENATIDPSGITLGLTSPETLAFFTASFGSEVVREGVLAPYLQRWQASDSHILQAAVEQAKNLFAHTWSVQLEPVENVHDDEGETMLMLAFALRDPDQGLAWFTALAEQERSGITRTTPDSFAFDTSWLAPPTAHLFSTMHARIDHGLLHLADSSRGLHQVLRRRSLDDLSSRADFRRLARQLPKASAGLGFIDANRVLANCYEALSHPLVMGTLWMGLRSQTNLSVDFSQLDARDLPSDFTPTVISLSRMPGGFRQASVGSFSPSQWALGGGLAVALIDKTFLEPMPVEAVDSFVLPEAEQELLRMIERE